MKPLKVLSLGAGVQSTTLLLMSCLGELPLLDAAVFADTQWEPKAVYDHLEKLTVFAAKAGIPVHRVTGGNLRDESLIFLSGGVGVRNRVGVQGRWASLPLYVKGGWIMRRQCTKYYKIRPIDRFVKHHLLGIPKGSRSPDNAVETWVGFSTDEIETRSFKRAHKWQTIRFPLVIDVIGYAPTLFPVGFNRDDCVRWLSHNGWSVPRSACINCPFRNDEEWQALTPAEFSEACNYDDQLRVHGEPFYVHRSRMPLREVVFDVKRNWDGVRDNECLGMCGS